MLKIFSKLKLMFLVFSLASSIADALPRIADEVPVEDRLERAKKLRDDPNFPLSAFQTQEVLEKVDDFLGPLESWSDIKINYTNNGSFLSGFNLLNPMINIPKMLGGAVDTFTLTDPQELEQHQNYVRGVLMHEYAHAVLQRHLEKNAHIVEYVESLKEATKKKHSDEVVSKIQRRQSYYLAYHELFADSVAYLITQDPILFKKILNHAYGSSLGTYHERIFMEVPKSSHWKQWRASVAQEKKEPHASIPPYMALWPQRTAISRMLIQGKWTAQEIASKLTSVVSDEITKLIADPAKLTSIETMNTSFSATAKAEFGDEDYIPAPMGTKF